MTEKVDFKYINLKIHKIALCIFILLFSINGNCQIAFQCHYDLPELDPDGSGFDILRLPGDSGFFCLHPIVAPPDTGLVLFRINNSGAVNWSKIYKTVPAISSTNLRAYQMLLLSDSTIMVSAYVNNKNLSLKLDYSGNLIASQKFTSGDIFMQKEVNGFIYGVGSRSHNFNYCGLFCKRNLNGDVIWSVLMSGDTTKQIYLTCFTPTSDNGFLLAGHRQIGNLTSSTVPYATVLIKIDSIGTIQWQTQLNFPGTSLYSIQVQEQTDGGYLFSMFEYYRGVFVKTNSIGQVQWNSYYQHNSQDLVFQKFENVPGNKFMVCGTIEYRILPLIIDSIGNPLVSKEIFHSDTAYLGAFRYNHQGLVGFGIKESLFNRSFFTFKTDTAFQGACGDSGLVYTTHSYSVTDSAISIVTVPVTSNITNPVIDDSYYPLSKSDYCPPLYLFSGQEEDAFNLTWGPTPAYDVITFNTDGLHEKLLSIFDLTGCLVSRIPFSGNSYTFYRSDIKVGLYIFELVSGNNTRRGKILFQ